jgi:hypothetical protein
VIAEIADRGTMLTLGSSFNVKPIATQVEDVADVERALASLAAGANGGLIVNSDISRSAIVWPSSQRQLAVPAIYPFAFFTDAGGLAAYGTDIPICGDALRRTLIASCAARSRLICRSKRRPSSSLSSTSRPPRYSASTCRPTLIARADEVIE